MASKEVNKLRGLDEILDDLPYSEALDRVDLVAVLDRLDRARYDSQLPDTLRQEAGEAYRRIIS